MLVADTTIGLTIEELVQRVEQLLAAMPLVVLLRHAGANENDYQRVARKLAAGIQTTRRLVVHGRPELAAELGVGLHFPARQIRTQGPKGCWTSRAVHDVDELREAELAGAAAVIAGTFYPTPSKPGMQTLGGTGLAAICNQTRLPVYAIGGVVAGTVAEARNAGAYGVAVCRGILLADDPVGVALELNLDEL